jgi:hypothetical protein
MLRAPEEAGRSSTRSGRRLARPLFLTLVAFYLLGSSGRIDTPDGVLMFRVTQSLVERRSAAVEPLPGTGTWGGLLVPDRRGGAARFYPKYGLGLPLAAIPSYVAGRSIAPLARPSEADLFETGPGRRRFWYDLGPANFREAFGAFAASWTNAVVVAATLTVVFLIGLELGFGAGGALATALAGAVATPLWAYSRTFFAEPLGGLGLAAFFYFARRGRRRDRNASFAAAGGFLGVAILAKPAHLVLLLPAAILLGGYGRGLAWRRAAGRAGACLAGLSLALAVALIYNQARFGDFLETGYGAEARQWTTPFWSGLTGLLFSPGRGMLLYFPLAVLVAVALRRFAAAFPLEASFIAACPLVLLVTYARWSRWEGGWCWGPRLLLPAIPVLLPPLAGFFESLPGARAGRAGVLVVLALALLVSIAGVLVDVNELHEWLHETYESRRAAFEAAGFGTSTELYRWSWAYSPLRRGWSFSSTENFLLPRSLQKPGIVTAWFGIWAAVLVGQGSRLWREGRSRGGS